MAVAALIGTAEADRTDGATLAVFRVAQCLMIVANLGRVPVFSTGDRNAPVTVNELCLLAIVVTGLMAAARRRALHIDRLAGTALVFAAVGAGSAIWNVERYGFSGSALVVSLAYLARWLAYFMLYIALRNAIARADAPSLWKPVEWMLLFHAGFGIIQAAFLPNFAQMVYPESREAVDWDVQGHRLVSTILEPNIVAGMLMIGLLVQLSMIATGVEVRRWKVGLMFLALVLTVSRSAAVALVAGVLALLLIRGLSKRLIRLMIVAGIAGLLALPQIIRLALFYNKFSFGEGSSGGERVVAWLRALGIFADHPIFGIGFNTYGFVAERYGYERVGQAAYGTDGGLLFVAVMTGLAGLAIYCVMLWIPIAWGRRVWRDPAQTPTARGLAMGAATSTVAIVVHSIFVNSILTTYVMEMLWVLWAIIGILAKRPPVARAAGIPRVVALRA